MINITAARVLANGDIDLDYIHPADPSVTTHHHTIPVECVQDRMVVYGTVTVADAIEQIVLEVCSMDVTDRNRFPSKAERLHAHTTHGPVTGLQAALASAHITVPDPTAAEIKATKDWFLQAFGQAGLERARGVAAGSLDVTKPWPAVADQHVPSHPNTPA